MPDPRRPTRNAPFDSGARRVAPPSGGGASGAGRLFARFPARPRALALGLALAAGVASGRTRAQPAAPEPEISWSAPDGCPTRADVLERMRRMLGGKVSRLDSPATAVVLPDPPSGFRLTISVGGSSRTVLAPTCAELADTAGLILALAADPSVRGAPPPPDSTSPAVPSSSPTPAAGPSAPPPSDATPPAVPATVAPAAPLVTASLPPASGPPLGPNGPVTPWPAPPGPDSAAPIVPPNAARAVARLHLSGGADAGTFAGPSPFVRAGGSLPLGPLRVGLAAVLAYGGWIGSAATADKGGTFWLAGGALGTCYVGAPSRLASIGAGLCAGVEVGALVAQGGGVAQPGAGVAPWVTPSATALVRWAFASRWAVQLDVSLLVPIVRPRFEVEGLGLIHEPSPIAGRLGAGFELDLGGR